MFRARKSIVSRSNGSVSRLLFPVLQHLRSDARPDQALKLAGGLRLVRTFDNSGDVPYDLHGRHDDSPREAPPAEHQGKKRVAELAFDPARAAAYGGHTAPGGDHERGIDPVRGMNVDRAAALALRADPAMNVSDLLVHDLLRHVFRKHNDPALLVALLVAEPQLVFLHPSEQDRRPAIRA